MDDDLLGSKAVRKRLARRDFLRTAGAGATLCVMGGVYSVVDEARAAGLASGRRPDGRLRVPPGQKVIEKLKPMGGSPGDPDKNNWRLRVHGLVEQPFVIDFRQLLGLPQVTRRLDVHCVTSWTVLGAKFTGVSIDELARRARVKRKAKHVVFEAAHGYTANVPLAEAIAPQNMIAHRLDDRPLARTHGGPARGVVPDLYFWKSAKWITGLRFVERDEPGYWETRGYHNHADPWREERYG